MQSTVRNTFDNLSDNGRSAIYMLIAMFTFVLNDTMTKLASSEASVFQVIFIRGSLLTVVLALLALRRGITINPLAYRDRFLWLRVMAEVIGSVIFLTALFNMPLANITAIAQVTPLALTLVLALFFGEKVGWRRYTAILLGFVGVLIIVRPGTAGFNQYSLLALVAMFGIITRDLATQRVAREIPSFYVVYLTAFCATLFNGAITLFTGWTALPTQTYLYLFAAAAFVSVGYLFSVMTMRLGEASYTAVFRYSVLIWAMILSVVVFGEVPDGPTIIGAIIIAGAGIYALRRGRVRRVA
ncbi:MAG: DMT family transporter [Anaerolineales bacterium]|nr:DMT family transporter [Anaerolineales bacterium]MCB0029352.1 DMT family transporter [Anaerolineales bacterium]MCB8960091.1 DMT family transporter [Ardenticatenales bacterium]